MPLSIEEVNIDSVDAVDLARMAELLRDADAEVCQPRRPSTTVDPSRLSPPKRGQSERWWIARADEDRVVGCATVTLRDSIRHADVGKVRVVVATRLRRRGIGTALLTAASDGAGVRTVYGWAPEFSAGHGFLFARFSRPRGEEEWSVLDIRRHRSRAGAMAGAGLVHRAWEGPCPTDLSTAFMEAHRELDIAPRGSEMGAERLTKDLFTRLEWQALEAGERWATVCVQDAFTGRVVGFTQITLPSKNETVAEQEFTGVVLDCRERGLGRWLKMAMLDDLIGRYPRIRFVVTQNATDNVPILSINRALGFRTYVRLVAWEASVRSLTPSR